MGCWLRNLLTGWEYTQSQTQQLLAEDDIHRRGRKPVKCGDFVWGLDSEAFSASPHQMPLNRHGCSCQAGGHFSGKPLPARGCMQIERRRPKTCRIQISKAAKNFRVYAAPEICPKMSGFV